MRAKVARVYAERGGYALWWSGREVGFVENATDIPSEAKRLGFTGYRLHHTTVRFT